MKLTIPIAAIALLISIALQTFAQPAEGPSMPSDGVPTDPPDPIVFVPEPKFQWKEATKGSLKFLLLQTASRFAFQAKTRHSIRGPYFAEYIQTLKQKPIGFMDGDPWKTNFVGHPIQGAAAYHLARINGASARQAFLWGVGYSTNFELGPIGEAGIGNVRLSPVDLVVTPAAGFALGAAEEWLLSKLEGKKSRIVRLARWFIPGHRFARMAEGL